MPITMVVLESRSTNSTALVFPCFPAPKVMKRAEKVTSLSQRMVMLQVVSRLGIPNNRVPVCRLLGVNREVPVITQALFLKSLFFLSGFPSPIVIRSRAIWLTNGSLLEIFPRNILIRLTRQRVGPLHNFLDFQVGTMRRR